jgi:hypothetical protein
LNNENKKFSITAGSSTWSDIYDLTPLKREKAVVPPATRWNNALGLVTSSVTAAALVTASLF